MSRGNDDRDDASGEAGARIGDRAPGPGVRRRGSWTNRIILGFAVLVALVAVGVIVASSLPGWWAGRVGAVADGSGVAAVFAGLTCGVVLTALPLLLLRLMVRRRARWESRLACLVLAAVLAAPNLTTLAITLGATDAAGTGAAVMDREAPGFRPATLGGAVLGVLAVLALWAMLSGRRRRRREIESLRTRLRLAEAARAGDDEDDEDEA